MRIDKVNEYFIINICFYKFINYTTRYIIAIIQQEKGDIIARVRQNERS